MTDSRALQKQTLLEQLADVLQNQAADNDDSLELRELVARMVEESRSWGAMPRFSAAGSLLLTGQDFRYRKHSLISSRSSPSP